MRCHPTPPTDWERSHDHDVFGRHIRCDPVCSCFSSSNHGRVLLLSQHSISHRIVNKSWKKTSSPPLAKRDPADHAAVHHTAEKVRTPRTAYLFLVSPPPCLPSHTLLPREIAACGSCGEVERYWKWWDVVGCERSRCGGVGPRFALIMGPGGTVRRQLFNIPPHHRTVFHTSRLPLH